MQRCGEMGDRFGAGSYGPLHNLDGISSGTFAPALSAPAYTVPAADALTTKVREGGRVNVRTSVAIGVNARARTGSPVPIGAEPFRQGREHGHGRFWPLLQDGV